MGPMRVVMGVGTVGEDALQFSWEHSISLVPSTLGPNLINGSVCRVYPPKVVPSVFTSPPMGFVRVNKIAIMLSVLTMYCMGIPSDF